MESSWLCISSAPHCATHKLISKLGIFFIFRVQEKIPLTTRWTFGPRIKDRRLACFVLFLKGECSCIETFQKQQVSPITKLAVSILSFSKKLLLKPLSNVQNNWPILEFQYNQTTNGAVRPGKIAKMKSVLQSHDTKS